MGGSPPDYDFLEQTLPRIVNADITRTLAANLIDLGQVIDGEGSERLYGRTIPTVAASPNIGEPSGSESDVALF